MTHPYERSGIVWPLLLFLLVIWIRPAGIGDGDDERYIRAALAWLDDGPHLGADHWALRFPLVLPLVASLSIFGPSEFAVLLPNLIYGVLLTVVSFAFGRVCLGPKAGFLLSLLVASSVALPFDPVETAITGPELFFEILALWLFVTAIQSTTTSAPRLFLAGVIAGLAWMCRETAAFLPLVFLMVPALGLSQRSAQVWLWPVIGFAAVIAVELLFYYVVTGDPVYRYRIDMGHGGSRDESGLLADAVRGDYLDLITDPLSRILLHPLRGPGLAVTGVATAYLITRRHMLSNSARQTMLVFGLAALTSMLVSAMAMSLESSSYFPIFPYAMSLIVAVAVSQAFATRVFGWMVAASMVIAAIGLMVLNLKSTQDVAAIRAATDIVMQHRGTARADWYTARRVETNLRLRGDTMEAARARIQPTAAPREGDTLLLTGLPHETWEPLQTWISIETRVLPPPTLYRLVPTRAASLGDSRQGRSATLVGLYRVQTDAPSE